MNITAQMVTNIIISSQRMAFERFVSYHKIESFATAISERVLIRYDTDIHISKHKVVRMIERGIYFTFFLFSRGSESATKRYFSSIDRRGILIALYFVVTWFTMLWECKFGSDCFFTHPEEIDITSRRYCEK